VERRRVVTCFLTHSGKVLILRRSKRVGTYQGRWAGVSGYVESEPPLDRAYIEMKEELGLDPSNVELIKEGGSLEVRDSKGGITWIVYPFLFQLEDVRKIELDWEHQEFKWISPEELSGFDTVPCLKEALELVLDK
jgi:8-oxo-dGTP pyrophosphatase MutT (NUDIX family)